MAFIGLNLHEVEAWDGKGGVALPPAENLILQIIGVKQERAKNDKQTLQLQVEMQVASEGELKGRKAISFYSIDPTAKPQARGRIKQLVTAAGIPLTPEGGFDDQQLIGTYIVADSVHEVYSVADAVTGTQVQKTSQKLNNERHVSVLQGGQQAQAQPAQAPRAPQMPQVPNMPQVPQMPQAPMQQFAPPQQFALPQAAPVPQQGFMPAAASGLPAQQGFAPVPGAPALTRVG